MERRELVEYQGGTRTVSLRRGKSLSSCAWNTPGTPATRSCFMHPAHAKRPYSPQMVRRMHNEIIKEAGLDHIRFADLRHTCAVLALQNGMGTEEVSQMLGHFRTSMTRQNYAPYLTCPAVKSENNHNEASQGGTAASGRYSGQPPEILIAIVRKVWYMFGSQGDDDDGKQTAQRAV